MMIVPRLKNDRRLRHVKRIWRLFVHSGNGINSVKVNSTALSLGHEYSWIVAFMGAGWSHSLEHVNRTRGATRP